MASVSSVAESVSVLKADTAVLQERISTVQKQIEVQDYVAVIQRLSVVESQLADMRKAKEESDKRYWQFVVLFVGGLITLGINLVVSFVRR